MGVKPSYPWLDRLVVMRLHKKSHLRICKILWDCGYIELGGSDSGGRNGGVGDQSKQSLELTHIWPQN